MLSFCTIVNNSHLPYAFTLAQSLKRYSPSVKIFILISDLDEVWFIKSKDSCTKILGLNDLSDTELLQRLRVRYKICSDAFRWSLKPLILIDLLQKFGCEKVFYADSDIHFFHSFEFLGAELGENSFLLSPHWRSMNPEVDEIEFQRLFSHGLFNAGFIGVTSGALKTLRWWASMCIYKCGKEIDSGLYDDQAYLNLFWIQDAGCSVLRHRGCNVAVWNRSECIRVLQSDGTVLINNQDPIIFIHFSNLKLMVEHDTELTLYIKRYSESLKQNGLEFDIYQDSVRWVDKRRSNSSKLMHRLRRILNKFKL